MLSRYIRNEIARRVSVDEDIEPEVLRAFGMDQNIEPEGAAELNFPPLDCLDGDDVVFCGQMPFELRVSVLGQTAVLDCRAIYTAALGDDDTPLAMATDTLKDAEVSFQVLKWQPSFASEDRDRKWALRQSPSWVDFNAAELLPREIHLVIRQLIENDALRRQETDS